MSASRVTQLTTRVCMAVLSNQHGLVWTSPSPAFLRMYGAHVAAVKPGRHSLAWRVLHAGEHLGLELVPTAAWLDVRGEPPLLEHTLRADTPGTVITMLWACHREAADTATLPDRTPSVVLPG